jgi:hypothetical protein
MCRIPDSSPLRIGFVGTLNVACRTIPQFQDIQPSQILFFLTWLMLEIWDEQIPLRQGRSNPRVIKKLAQTFSPKSYFIEEPELKASTLTSPFLTLLRA